MKHLEDDDLILYLYGEAEDPEAMRRQIESSEELRVPLPDPAAGAGRGGRRRRPRAGRRLRRRGLGAAPAPARRGETGAG